MCIVFIMWLLFVIHTFPYQHLAPNANANSAMEINIAHKHTGPFPDICSWNEDENFKKSEGKSPVWDYFLLHKKVWKAKCIKCDKILSIKGGSTTSMKNHMQMVHKIKVVTKSTYCGLRENYKNEEGGNGDCDKSAGDDLDYFGEEENPEENPVLETEDKNFKKNDSANPIWDCFLRHINGEEAKCIRCDRIVSNKGGATSAMRAHMRMVHKMKVVTKANYVNSFGAQYCD